MFAIVGALLDRFWPHLLTIVGTVVLALFGTVWQNASSAIGAGWTIALILGAAVVSAAGVIIATVRYERGAVAIQSDMLTSVKASLVPISERLITLPQPLSSGQYEDAMTELAMHCRFFARDAGMADSNYYRLIGTTLTRVNRAAGTARERFESSRRRDARAVEERAVVDRIIARQAVLCRDVQKVKEQKRLCLAPGERNYRSFVSVPVTLSNGAVVGMLSLNSSERNGLSSVHVTFLESVAKLIAGIHAVNPNL